MATGYGRSAEQKLNEKLFLIQLAFSLGFVGCKRVQSTEKTREKTSYYFGNDICHSDEWQRISAQQPQTEKLEK